MLTVSCSCLQYSFRSTERYFSCPRAPRSLDRCFQNGFHGHRPTLPSIPRSPNGRAALILLQNEEVNKLVSQTRLLGIIIDDSLSWSPHLDSICKKVGRKIGAIRRTYRQLTPTARRQFFVELCAGQCAGAEAAVHAISECFQQEDVEAALFVDASNAFNSLNRAAAMHNIRIVCPSVAIFIINIYRRHSRLFIVGGGEIISSEGTTQGDPMGMAVYALALLPLVSLLWDELRQAWFADDAAATGELFAIRRWWIRLCELGHLFGYFPNAGKSWLVVKQEYLPKAEKLFADLGVQITAAGRRYLGGAIGCPDFVRGYLEGLIQEWLEHLERLTTFAVSQPHAAYAAFVHGFSAKWSYFQRVIPTDQSAFAPLEKALKQKFLPALTGQSAISLETRRLLALPSRLGGLGIRDPVTTSAHEHQASKIVARTLTEAIKDGKQQCDGAFLAASQAKNAQVAIRKEREKEELEALKSAGNISSRRLDLLQEKGTSSWLTAIPIDNHDLFLHKGAFRDALALRYGWKLQHLPDRCACGGAFSVDHAMACKIGGFSIHRHNEIRDFTADCLREVCPDVEVEPQLQPLTTESLALRSARVADGDRPDIRAKGLWTNTWHDTFVDVRVFHPDCPSYLSTAVPALYKRFEKEKKRQYGQRVREVELGSFTPIVFSTTGGMGAEAQTFYRRLAGQLSIKKNMPFHLTMKWLRTHLSVILLRSSLMCLRGSRSIRRRRLNLTHVHPEVVCFDSRLV